MKLKEFCKKAADYVREFGKITPIALVTTFLPMVGSATLLVVAYPLGGWLREHWQTGAPLFLLGTIFFCGLALLPTNVLGILSGWSFGLELGLTLMLAGIVCAATLSFLIHSRIVGEKLPQVFEKHPKAQAVYRALIGQSLWRTTLIIFLLRLSPAMPFALTNFLMASARVPLKSFVAGTLTGMMPRTSAVVLVGSQLSELRFDDPQEAWLIVFGIAATIVSIIFISLIARRALERLTKQAAATA